MKFFQVTPTRVRALEAKWRSTINRLRGPIPLSLAIAHMVAESNGVEEPTIRDAQRYPLGLMQIPRRIGTRFKYDETALKVPTTSIYVWTLKTLNDSAYVHANYASWWSSATYDFWLAVRLFFIMDSKAFNALLKAALDDGSSYKSLSGVQSWVRTKMEKTQRFGLFTQRDLTRIMQHLDEVKAAMILLDGPDKASYAFTDAPALTPGTPLSVLGTVNAL